MNELELEIAETRKRLEFLRRQKAKLLKPPKPKSDKPVGRPRVNAKKIKIARELAKDFPIVDVALTVGISTATLYRYDIKRYLMDMQEADDKYRESS